MAVENSGCTPIVRLGEAGEPTILKALDAGAQTILVSQVSTPQEAKRIVTAARYAPQGERGLSPFTRNHGYSDADMPAKLKHANAQTFVGVLVEGDEGINNLEAIAAVPGLDMIYLGIYDLSQAVGTPGDLRNPKVINMLKTCSKVASAHGLAAGSVARDKEYIALLQEAGFRFISYRVDAAILHDGLVQAKEWFEELGKK
jgi:4-hydroxy-2-oxoheptanedioate aldolase